MTPMVTDTVASRGVNIEEIMEETMEEVRDAEEDILPRLLRMVTATNMTGRLMDATTAIVDQMMDVADIEEMVVMVADIEDKEELYCSDKIRQ